MVWGLGTLSRTQIPTKSSYHKCTYMSSYFFFRPQIINIITLSLSGMTNTKPLPSYERDCQNGSLREDFGKSCTPAAHSFMALRSAAN